MILAAMSDSQRGRLLSTLCRFTTPSQRLKEGFLTVEGVLEVIRGNGFSPATIIDVGAYAGDWARMARRVFPEATLYLIDGNPEREQALSLAVGELGGKAKHFIALLGAEERQTATLHQLDTGSSVLRELTTFPAKDIQVPMHTLDSLLSAESAIERGAILLKLDVQGYELEVLKGGLGVLSRSEIVVLEVSTLPYNEGAPLFAEVIAFMHERGFAVFDLGEQFRRQTDQALCQLDVVFARHDSPLRQRKKYWLNEP